MRALLSIARFRLAIPIRLLVFRPRMGSRGTDYFKGLLVLADSRERGARLGLAGRPPQHGIVRVNRDGDTARLFRRPGQSQKQLGVVRVQRQRGLIFRNRSPVLAAPLEDARGGHVGLGHWHAAFPKRPAQAVKGAVDGLVPIGHDEKVE